jgi:hypothetical protein
LRAEKFTGGKGKISVSGKAATRMFAEIFGEWDERELDESAPASGNRKTPDSLDRAVVVMTARQQPPPR